MELLAGYATRVEHGGFAVLALIQPLDPFTILEGAISIGRETSRSADELLISRFTILRFTKHDSRLADHEIRNRKQEKRCKVGNFHTQALG